MDLVVDPRLPEYQARFLRESAPMLRRMRGGWAPRREPNPDRGPAPYLVMLFLPPGLLLMNDPAVLVPFLLFVAVAITLFCAVPMDEDGLSEYARFERASMLAGGYVLVAGLDEESARLWRRTRGALESARRSDFLDAEGAMALRGQEWLIARLLLKLSALRADHVRLVTPDIEEAVRPLTGVLERSQAGVERRVAVLERIAVRLSEAERTHRSLERLRVALPRYRDLLDDAVDNQGR